MTNVGAAYCIEKLVRKIQSSDVVLTFSEDQGLPSQEYGAMLTAAVLLEAKMARFPQLGTFHRLVAKHMPVRPYPQPPGLLPAEAPPTRAQTIILLGAILSEWPRLLDFAQHAGVLRVVAGGRILPLSALELYRRYHVAEVLPGLTTEDVAQPDAKAGMRVTH